MFVLSAEELVSAQHALKEFFPGSIKVYGCLFHINNSKPHNFEVIADSWPDFKAIVCKPKQKATNDREGEYNIYSVYSKDKESLKCLLDSTGVLIWDTYTLLAGVDLGHIDAAVQLAALHGVPSKVQAVMHVLMLTDSCQLSAPRGVKVRPLTPDDADLVNKTWKHGGSTNSYNSVMNYISNHPSLCVVTEEEPNPVSWLLVYNHCALGLLYTRPEYRNRGYARLLISTMSHTLRQQGYPIYCFVEEGNAASYGLFTSLGFTEDPSHRSVWFELNNK